MTGIVTIEYNNVEALREVLKTHGTNVCGFLVEPIQVRKSCQHPHHDREKLELLFQMMDISLNASNYARKITFCLLLTKFKL